MKKLIAGMCVAAASIALAGTTNEVAKGELEKTDKTIFWGFANYGLYSGYQLYGSLVNNEPTLQGYIEGNVNLVFDDLDLGYVGGGVWSNTDLTKRRNWNNLGQLCNEWDFNVHWGRTFWFDDDHQWGLTYRTSVVWYYYPNKNYKGNTDHDNHNFTTIDWNHYFELQNPYVIPYVNAVHEYKKGASLVQFGVKKPLQLTEKFSLCPIVELVWRERQYAWCFPTCFNGTIDGHDCNKNSGLATLKLELDGTYMFSQHWGVFAKVAFCSIIDPDLRDNIDDMQNSGHNELYGAYLKDYVWGGVGVCCNF